MTESPADGAGCVKRFCTRGRGGTTFAATRKRKTASSDPAGHIITLPYELQQKAALFKQKYRPFVGCFIQSKRPGLAQLGIDPKILSNAVEKLGFDKVEEELAEAKDFSPPEEAEGKPRLNVLFLTSANRKLKLSGPSYLDIKPFVLPMYLLCAKWFLVQSLRRIEEEMRQRKLSFINGSGRQFSYEEFTPFTLNLNNKRLEAILASQPGVYLAKPNHGSMGQRQKLVRIHQDRVQKDLLEFLLSSEFLNSRLSEVILQRYIERPLLVDRRKFDMRVYMLVTNVKRAGDKASSGVGGRLATKQSGYFVFMHPGFLRLCTGAYDPDHNDLAVHLTNQSIQAKQTSIFTQLKEVTTWYPDELNDYINKRRRLPRKDWAKDVLYPKVGAILGYISALFRRYLDDRNCETNTFRILGVDFLVDESLRIYLLEFNSHPSWGRQTQVLDRLKPSLWREAACLTCEVATRYRCDQPVRDDLLATRQNFRLVYSSEDPDMARQSVARMYN